MRARSPKRAAQERQRRVMKAAMFDAAPWCARCGKGASTVHDLDAHELLSRARGGSITDPDNIVLLCRPCHEHITTNPAAAEAEGWSRSRLGGDAA